MSYQQCTRFRTALDFDCEYLWTGSSSRQPENGVINYDYFPRSMKIIWRTLVHWRKNDLRPMTLKLNTVRAVVNVHVHAKYHQAECSGSWVIVLTKRFCPISQIAVVKNPKMRSCGLDLWLMTLKLSGFLVVFNEHVHAKFHQAKCMQRLMCYRAYRDTDSAENNAVRRYRADSRLIIWLVIAPVCSRGFGCIFPRLLMN